MYSCRCLDVTNGRLSREPFEPEYLTSLTSLRLSNNGIKGVQGSTFATLSALTWLELNNNQLSSLPEEIGDMESLKGLLLHNNNIKHLPDSLPRLSSLTLLTLASNHLTYPHLLAIETQPSFPDGWCDNLDALTALDLSRNQLTQVPAGVCELPNIRRLILDHNSLEDLPEISAGSLSIYTSIYLSICPSTYSSATV